MDEVSNHEGDAAIQMDKEKKILGIQSTWLTRSDYK
jgi:hypothetical protein